MFNKNGKLKRLLTLSLILVLSSSVLTACGKEEDAQKEDSIYSYKTEFVGDNSKVVSIASHIQYPDGLKYDSVKILSDKEPYGLVIYLNKDKDIENPDLFNQAVMTFALIDNLSNLKYELKDTNEVIEEFNRDDVNLTLRENGKDELNKIGSSEENLNKFIESEKNV